MSNIMNAIKTEIANTNLTETENGALAYERHVSDIVTFFYTVSSMRSWTVEKIVDEFRKCLAEDFTLAVKMLFFIRDVRGGLGERRLFRAVFRSLDDDTIGKLAHLVPEYGRWDDLIDMLEADGKQTTEKARNEVWKIVSEQWNKDVNALNNPNASVSLLAKWLPSCRGVAQSKVKLAKAIYKRLGLNERTYRKTLSALRERIRVVERDMCAGAWSDIDYNRVPSKANLNYANAFLRHDEARRREYLGLLKSGDKSVKINAGTLFPYEISSKYGHYPVYDEALEQMWKSLSESASDLKNAIVVRDGSSSMSGHGIGVGKATALDVATSLAIMMSEHLPGEYRNKFITFSAKPRYVDLSGCKSLCEKVQMAMRCADCENTDIEKVMDLILSVAQKNSIPQSEIPSVVIVSDMEFDESAIPCDHGVSWWDTQAEREKHPEKFENRKKTLFETIGQKWKDAGYELPRIVFWNVASLTCGVPMQENSNGVALVSGFSKAIFDLVSGNSMVPIDVVKMAVGAKRYDAVEQCLGK